MSLGFDGTLCMQDTVHRGGRWRLGAVCAAPGRCESGGISPAAFEAGAVAGGEGGRLVEEEDLGIADAHHASMAAPELGPARNPGARLHRAAARVKSARCNRPP